MSIDSRLIDILVCPVTKTPVKPLPKDKLALLNHAIGQQSIRDQAGSPVEGALDEALVTTDGKTIYPVEDGIPVMLEEHGIAASQIPGW
jgi:uncharacterized protein YbaR (Trm112 family)